MRAHRCSGDDQRRLVLSRWAYLGGGDGAGGPCGACNQGETGTVLWACENDEIVDVMTDSPGHWTYKSYYDCIS